MGIHPITTFISFDFVIISSMPVIKVLEIQFPQNLGFRVVFFNF